LKTVRFFCRSLYKEQYFPGLNFNAKNNQHLVSESGDLPKLVPAAEPLAPTLDQ
jgi:hypothetical protein